MFNVSALLLNDAFLKCEVTPEVITHVHNNHSDNNYTNHTLKKKHLQNKTEMRSWFTLPAYTPPLTVVSLELWTILSKIAKRASFSPPAYSDRTRRWTSSGARNRHLIGATRLPVRHRLDRVPLRRQCVYRPDSYAMHASRPPYKGTKRNACDTSHARRYYYELTSLSRCRFILSHQQKTKLCASHI